MEFSEGFLALLAAALNLAHEIMKTDKFQDWARQKYMKKLIRRYKRLMKKIQKEQKKLMPIITYMKQIIQEQELLESKPQ